jgi:hypothetical protein
MDARSGGPSGPSRDNINEQAWKNYFIARCGLAWDEAPLGAPGSGGGEVQAF